MKRFYKKIIMAVSAILVVLGVNAQEITLSLDEGLKFKPGEEKQVAVYMNNGEIGITNVDVFLAIPEGFSFSKMESDSYADKSERFNNSYMTTIDLDDAQTLHFFAMTFGVDPVSGQDGLIFICKVKASEDVTLGDVNFEFKDVALTELSGTAHNISSSKVLVNVYAEYAISASSADESKGAVTIVGGGETVASGESVTATATPVDGYEFVNWTAGETEVSKENPYTFKASKDIALVANFKAKKFNITFDVDGTLSANSLEFGSAITKPADPTKVGYTFVGWDPEVSETVPAANATYKAQWTINQYTITFDTDGGSAIEAITQDYNSEILTPADPTKEGYTFTGWDPEVPEKVPATDTTYKAQWTVNQYIVKFVLVDGTVLKSDELDFGTAITAPEYSEEFPETREDDSYRFDHWDPALEEGATVPANNMTYTAVYVPPICTINFMVADTVFGNVEALYGEEVPEFADQPTMEGHTFAGWKDADGNDLPETMNAQTLDVYAQWTVNEYKVYFNTFGSVYMVDTVKFGAEITLPEVDPEAEGYTFAGWGEYPETMPADSVVVEAVFDPIVYRVSYLINYSIYKTDSVACGSVIAPAKAPEKEGYTFSGWGNLPEIMPAGDIVVNGRYYLNQYYVTFIAGDSVVSSEALDFGAEITVPEAPEIEGYTFDGWTNVAATVPANDLVYRAGYTITPKDVEITPSEETVIVEFKDAFVDEDGNEVSLVNAQIGDIFCNIDAADGSGYDVDDECLVLNTPVSAEDMEVVLESKVGSTALAERFSGIIVSVKGKGSIEIDCQTIGSSVLGVLVGNSDAPTVIQQDERGVAKVEYDVENETLVYIYAITSTASAEEAEAPRRAVAAANSVKVWKVTIVPTKEEDPIIVGINAVHSGLQGAEGIYTLDGRKVNPAQVRKGLYIVDGKKTYLK